MTIVTCPVIDYSTKSSLVLLKKMKNCIPLHLFLDIWLQKLSSCYVSLSDSIASVFVNPWKNQKYLFILNLLTSLLQMKWFLRNNKAFTFKVFRRRVDFMHNILLATVRLRSEAAVWRAPESTCYYKFQQWSSFFT